MDQQSALHESSGGFYHSIKIRLHHVLSEVGQASTLFFSDACSNFSSSLSVRSVGEAVIVDWFQSL